MDTTGTVGYVAMFEQFHPTDLLGWCKLAEESGFTSIMASDHFHSWALEQDQVTFIWSRLGALGAWLGALGAQTNLRFGISVTPLGYHYHPTIVAQAAATLEAMHPSRFWLSLEAEEALNRHVVGEYWPEASARLRTLVGSIEVICRLFAGEVVEYDGEHLKLESTKLYTLPEKPPPIYVATADPMMSEHIGRLCDGIITVDAPDEKIKILMDKFEEGAQGCNKDPSKMPRILQLHVSWADNRQEAEEQAVREWSGGISFPKTDIRNSEDFAAMDETAQAENFKGRVLTSPDLDKHLDHIQHYIDLGFDEIYVHNVGHNQEEFVQAYGERVIPKLKWLEKG